MGLLLSRTVEIRITNRTQNITLKNPRTYFEYGYCSKPPDLKLNPGSSGTCCFRGHFPFWGVAGILVYEADFFTLAIYFSNPIDYRRYSMELGLELSLSKAHLGRLVETYARMAKGTYSNFFIDTEFDRVIMKGSKGVAQLNDSSIRVSAIMSYATASTLEVMLEDQCWTEKRSLY